MDAREMAKIAIAAMEEKKAEDIRIIDIEEVSSIADFFIIANGNNPSQVHAIADFVEEKLGRALITRDGQEFELKAQGWQPDGLRPK